MEGGPALFEAAVRHINTQVEKGDVVISADRADGFDEGVGEEAPKKIEIEKAEKYDVQDLGNGFESVSWTESDGEEVMEKIDFVLEGPGDVLKKIDLMVHVLLDQDWITLTAYMEKYGYATRARVYALIEKGIVPAENYAQLPELDDLMIMKDVAYDPRSVNKNFAFTEAEKEAIALLYFAGKSPSEIADEYGCSRTYPRKIARKMAHLAPDGFVENDEFAADSDAPADESEGAKKIEK